MIQSPPFIENDWQRSEQLLYSSRKFRVSGRWILNLVQRARESSKVVDRPGSSADSNRSSGNIPMRRDRENPPWPGNPRSDRVPLPRVIILLDGIHRIAMAEEDSRHELWHSELLTSEFTAADECRNEKAPDIPALDGLRDYALGVFLAVRVD